MKKKFKDNQWVWIKQRYDKSVGIPLEDIRPNVTSKQLLRFVQKYVPNYDGLLFEAEIELLQLVLRED